MPQLRKSASFRSRIPVRRSNVPNRRCCSPPAATISNKSDNGSNGNRSYLSAKRSRRNQKIRNLMRRYSSSSYSSSDESFISDQPIKKKINHFNSAAEFFHTSNDALSLNALLDSVSSGGTFSSPPSPTQFLYGNSIKHNSSEGHESEDRYDLALEKLRINNNLSNIGVKLPYPSQEETRKLRQKLEAQNFGEVRPSITHYYHHGSDPSLKVKQLKDDWYKLRNEQCFNGDKRCNKNAPLNGDLGNCRQAYRMKKILQQIPSSARSSQDDISILPSDLRKLPHLKRSNKKQKSQDYNQHNMELQWQQRQQQHKHRILDSSNVILRRLNPKRKEPNSPHAENRKRIGFMLHSSALTPSMAINEASKEYFAQNFEFRDRTFKKNCLNNSNLNNAHPITENDRFAAAGNFERLYAYQNENQSHGNGGGDGIKRDTNMNIDIQNKFDLPVAASAYNATYELTRDLAKQQQLYQLQHEQQQGSNSYKKKRNGIFWFTTSSSHPDSPNFEIESHSANRSSENTLSKQQQQQQKLQHHPTNTEQSQLPDYQNETNLLWGINNEMKTLKIRTFENDFNLMGNQKNQPQNSHHCNQQQQHHHQHQRYNDIDRHLNEDAGLQHERKVQASTPLQVYSSSSSFGITKLPADAETELCTTFNQENYKNMCRIMAANSFQHQNNKNTGIRPIPIPMEEGSGSPLPPPPHPNVGSLKEANTRKSKWKEKTANIDAAAPVKNDIVENRKRNQINENRISSKVSEAPNNNSNSSNIRNGSTNENNIDVSDDDADDCVVDIDNNDNSHIGWYKVNENFWQLKKKKQKRTKQQQQQQQAMAFNARETMTNENERKYEENDRSYSKFNKVTKQQIYNKNDRTGMLQYDNNNDIDNKQVDAIDEADDDDDVDVDSEMYYQNVEDTDPTTYQNQSANNNNIHTNHPNQQHIDNRNATNRQCDTSELEDHQYMSPSASVYHQSATHYRANRINQISHFDNLPKQFVKGSGNLCSTAPFTPNNKQIEFCQQLNVIGIPTTTLGTTTATTNQLPNPYLNRNNPHGRHDNNNSISCNNDQNFVWNHEKMANNDCCSVAAVAEATSASDRTRTPTNCGTELAQKYLEAKRRPLPQIPVQEEIFPPKPTASYRSECELSGSYVSLECPSPPGPPTCLPESRRDPQVRLSNYLKTLYTDLALKEPIIPAWAIPVAPGALSAARLEPELRLHGQSHGFTDCLTVDQLLLPLHTKDGNFLEAPRRVLIECPSWASRSHLALRILHGWAREPPWPPKGTPIAMALFIPLAEIKRSFANYVEKELILKGPMNPFANGFGGFTAAWNSLETLGPKLLFVLDGYDNQRGSPKRKGKQYPPDVHDLLDGKIFPEARVIITTSITSCNELLPLIQRHVTFEGLTWGRSASLLGGGQWGAAPSRLLDTVQECPALRKIVRTPLGCLAIAAIFEATAGDLPTDELDVIESVLHCIAPGTSSVNVAELGRLLLFCLKMKRPCITMSELRMYCSSPESNMLGCLDKGLLLGKSARKKGEFIYGPMCPDLAEFLAANYIGSLSNRPGLLSAEITGLTIGDELDPDMLKVIKYAMGLLGPRSHILLSKLTPLWLSPQTIFSLALAGGNSEENLSALCDILGISKHPPISPLESKPLWVQVRSAPTELMGWGMALKSPTCTLKNLELIYQLEKHHLLDARNAMEIFLESLDMNESVSTLRITSLIENEVKDSEIGYLGSCVAKALVKPRLESFELILTLLEEDPPILKLQPVVSALCRSIPRQPKLNCLQLDLGLSTSQLVQLCSVLDKCPNITRLSLPHLRCERGAVTALATLLAARPLNFLSIPSCWGARDDPPSSSGVSMGSGSGSSTGTSGLIKQGSLTGVPSPRAYPPGLFSSLPRGMYVPTATMGRSATLPRQPIEPPADKRSCDSVVSKTWYPTPACDGGPHSSGTLHDLLLAAREPYSKLHGIDLSKAQLSLEDSMCLGETVRLSNTLHTLKLEGSSRLSEILPSVLGASESPCLQMLSIGSPRLNLEDSVIAMSARSLTSCTTLRLLSLDGWSFRVEIPSTLSILRAFLSLTSIRELSLANCRLQIGIFKSDSKIVNPFESRSVVVLKLSSAQVTLGDSMVWKGPQLLPIISGFPCLRELDLSAPARSGLGSTTHSTPLIIDDKCLISFFQSLHTHFSLLNTLKICNWVIHFDDPAKTLKTLSKCIRNSPISHLKLDGISVLDRVKKLRIESNFLHCFISSLPLLRWMGISLSGKKEDQITAIGNSVLDLKGYEIDIKLSESTIEHAKLMAQAISLDGKFDIKVSTFGTSSGILIHAEKSGTKSLNRKSNKD